MLKIFYYFSEYLCLLLVVFFKLCHFLFKLQITPLGNLYVLFVNDVTVLLEFKKSSNGFCKSSYSLVGVTYDAFSFRFSSTNCSCMLLWAFSMAASFCTLIDYACSWLCYFFMSLRCLSNSKTLYWSSFCFFSLYIFFDPTICFLSANATIFFVLPQILMIQKQWWDPSNVHIA